MKTLLSAIDRLNMLVGEFSKWLIVVVAVIMTYDVVMRYAFNDPSIWVFDISYMLGGAFFALGMGYTLLKESHVRVDVFYSYLSKRNQAIVDVVLTALLFFPTFGLLIFYLVPFVYDSWITSEKSLISFWRPVMYPFKAVFLISVILLFLQGFSDFIRNIQFIFEGEKS
ncbi:TRAP transporter small permease subunit [Alcaligenaceae bacterium CGII-47]|nr:TRAP transporter small permease subunit [Alcaligenaceae bacterium CGII-47]